MKVVENEETKHHYVIINDSIKERSVVTGEEVEYVIYKDHKRSTLSGYEEVPEEDKRTYKERKSDFLKKFTLCLDL